MKFFNWKKKSEPEKSDMNIDIFFKAFILDTLNALPPEKNSLIEEMNLDKTFNTDFGNWKKTIKKVLNLSDTIEIAIKDLWLRNSKIAENEGSELIEDQFANLFIKNYYAEDSKIDIWEDESVLLLAKKRIADSNLAD